MTHLVCDIPTQLYKQVTLSLTLFFLYSERSEDISHNRNAAVDVSRRLTQYHQSIQSSPKKNASSRANLSSSIIIIITIIKIDEPKHPAAPFSQGSPELHSSLRIRAYHQSGKMAGSCGKSCTFSVSCMILAGLHSSQLPESVHYLFIISIQSLGSAPICAASLWEGLDSRTNRQALVTDCTDAAVSHCLARGPHVVVKS